MKSSQDRIIQKGKAFLHFRAFLIAFLITPILLFAEGTPQLAPNSNDAAGLYIGAGSTFNNSGVVQGNYGAFAYVGSASRLYFNMQDPTTETVCLGFSQPNGNRNFVSSPLEDVRFRIVAPDGTPITCWGDNDQAGATGSGWQNISSTTANISTGNTGWNEIANGTYSPYIFDPAALGCGPFPPGDFYVEFYQTNYDSEEGLYVENFDITVKDASGVAVDGRVWSNNWGIGIKRDDPIAGQAPSGSFARAFRGAFYVCSEEGFVTKISFDSNSVEEGFRAGSFNVFFNTTGPMNTGDVITDRQSLEEDISQDPASRAELRVFLNDPDEGICPTGEFGDFKSNLDLLTRCGPSDFCINVTATKPGLFEVLIDINGNSINDGKPEYLLAYQMDDSDISTNPTDPDYIYEACIPWNGEDADGNPVPASNLNIKVSYSQGTYNFPVHDAEYNDVGFFVETIRPCPCSACNGGACPLDLFYDDSMISDANTLAPTTELNGCMPSCHAWSSGTTSDFGNRNTINTWWYAKRDEVDIPFTALPDYFACDVLGDDSVCSEETTIFTASVTALPSNTTPTDLFTYNWEGPNGFATTSNTTGAISDAGTYSLTVTDGDGCTFTCSRDLLASAQMDITAVPDCDAMNTDGTVDVEVTISGGVAPYTYTIDSGAPQISTTNVIDLNLDNNATVSFSITDTYGCFYSETVTASCCSLDVDCSNLTDANLACASEVPAADTTLIIVNDFCTSFEIVSNDVDNGGVGCTDDPLVITRTYTVTDALGSTFDCVQTFTIADATLPTISCTDDVMDFACNPVLDADGLPIDLPRDTDALSVNTDNCSTTTISTSDVTAISGCVTTLTRTYTIEDACGNTASCDRIYTWTTDTTAPSITCEDDTEDFLNGTNYGCNPILDDDGYPIDIPDDNDIVTTSADDCSVAILTSTDDVSTVDCETTLIRTYTITDECGNANSCDKTYIWTIDVDPPTLVCNGDPITDLACNPTLDADGLPTNLPSNDDAITVSDDCGAVNIQTSDVTSSDGVCGFTLTRTYTVNDFCGNTATCDRVFIWTIDTEAPTISCDTDEDTEDFLGETNLGCNPVLDDEGLPVDIPADADAVVLGVDNCGNATLTSSDILTTEGCETTLIRTYTITDACGNSNSCDKTYVWTIDVDPPTIVCNGDPITDYGCNPDLDANNLPTDIPIDFDAVTVSDEVCGGAFISSEDNLSNDGCLYTLIRTYTVTDACGNAASCSRTYTWKAYTQVPTITCQGDAITDLGCNPDLDTNGNPITIPANDNAVVVISDCASYTITSSDVTNTASCGAYTLDRTYTVTDECGNVASCQRSFTWTIDVDPPVIGCTGGDLVFGCNPTLDANGLPVGIPGLYTDVSIAPDACDNIDVSVSEQVLMQGCNKILVRVYTALDACGNSASCQREFSWQEDTEAPTLEFNHPLLDGLGNGAVINVTCTEIENITMGLNEVTVVDNCDSVDVVFYDNLIGQGDCNTDGYILQMECTWTATDACGNSASIYFILNLVDTESPTFVNTPADITVTCGNDTQFGYPEIEDDCSSNNLHLMYNDQTVYGDCPDDYVKTRTWLAVDACGNTATFVQTITSIELAPELVFVNPDLIAIGDGGTLEVECQELSDLGIDESDVAVTDDCSSVQVVFEDVSVQDGNCNTDGYVRIMECCWIATDECGNTDELCIFVKVVDNTPPEFISMPDDVTLSCTYEDPEFPIPGIWDCPGATVNLYYNTETIAGDCGEDYSIVRTWTAVDKCGNSSTAQHTYYYENNPPILYFTNPQLVGMSNGDEMEVACQNLAPNMFGVNDAAATDDCSTVSMNFIDEVVEEDDCSTTGYRQRYKCTWRATDDCGNTTELFMYVKVTDDTEPYFYNAQPDITVSCGNIPAPHTPTFRDVCEGNLVPEYEERRMEGDGCNSGMMTLERVWRAFDDCGNEKEYIQRVYVEDNEGPVFIGTLPEDEVAFCEMPSIPTGIRAFDVCMGTNVAVTFQEIVADDCNASTCLITRMWTATDDCGNVSTHTQIVEYSCMESCAFSSSYWGNNPELIAEMMGCTSSTGCTARLKVSSKKLTPRCIDRILPGKPYVYAGWKGCNVREYQITDLFQQLIVMKLNNKYRFHFDANMTNESYVFALHIDDLLKGFCLDDSQKEILYPYAGYRVQELYKMGEAIYASANDDPQLADALGLINGLFDGCGPLCPLDGLGKDETESVVLDPDKQRLFLMPNPTAHTLQMVFESDWEREDVLVSIFDLTGRQVFQSQYNLIEGKNIKTMNVSHFPEGMYVVSVRIGSKVYFTEKFVKVED